MQPRNALEPSIPIWVKWFTNPHFWSFKLRFWIILPKLCVSAPLLFNPPIRTGGGWLSPGAWTLQNTTVLWGLQRSHLPKRCKAFANIALMYFLFFCFLTHLDMLEHFCWTCEKWNNFRSHSSRPFFFWAFAVKDQHSGDDCPYAHAQGEIRHPRDESKEENKPIDPKDLIVRVYIPIDKFLGGFFSFFPQQQHFAMGSLAQISSGAIRCSFNTRFRARFRRVQKVPVQILRSGSRRFRCRCWGEVSEGSGAVIWWGTMCFRAITVDCAQRLYGGFAMNCQAVGDSAWVESFSHCLGQIYQIWTNAIDTSSFEFGKISQNIPRFEGDDEDSRRRNAYLTILGPGASNVRGIMKKANCRLHLRGLGTPATKDAEQMHLVVNPKAGDEIVTQEQQELVKRAVDDIVENGKLPDAIEVKKSIPKPERPRSPSRKRSVSYKRSRSRRQKSWSWLQCHA